MALKYYWKRIHDIHVERNLIPVLENLSFLYGLSCLDKHLLYFYQGEYANGPDFVSTVKDGVLEICSILKPDIVSVIDALAPPDFVVNSVLGKSDGKVSNERFTLCLS